jgi:glutathione S-transferase
VPIERPNLPAVAAYFERLRERPAFLKNVDIPLS